MITKLYPINKKLVDVFYGDGWDNWSRWFVKPDGSLALVAGQEPPASCKQNLLTQLKQRSKN